MGGNLECAAHIAAPGLRRRHRALAGRRAGALEGRRRDGFAREPSQRPCEFCRLVVTPMPQPRCVQRYGDNHVRFLQQRTARPVQPARKAGHEVQPIGMFQGQDGTTALLVIAHHRPGTVEGRRIGETGRTVRVTARIEFKRQPAAETGRSVEKLNILPASGAKAARLGHLRAATDAQRRIEKVERTTPGTPQTAFQNAAHRG